ncbi:MAG: hypothetical protein J2P57_18815 [Acidimicrobiaceae bacterium]|nr:hypothetical protein [Acidimicrobiaceae bacterium]
MNRDLSPEEMAAVVAAIELAWPRPAAVSPEPPPAAPVWRFSGRWWARPDIARRERPWITPSR